MYVVKKRLQRAKQQFKRDNEFGFPYNKSDVEPKQRKEFITALTHNKDFVPTYTNNYEKFKGSARDIRKKFNAFDYFCIAMFGVFCGTFSYVATTANASKFNIIQKNFNTSVVLFTLIGLLAGLGIGIGNQIALNRENNDTDSLNIYSRLSVRLFDLMHKRNPDLDENILKACNPEMARVIRALMIANMTDADVLEIQSVAQNVAKLLHNMSTNNKSFTIIQLDRELKNAMAIIEQNLSINQPLYDAILGVYRGAIPVKFVLQDKQKTR